MSRRAGGRMLKPKDLQIGLALACLAFPAGSGAEILRFRDGTIAHLPAEIAGESVRIETAGGSVRLPGSAFGEVLPGHWADRDWPSHRERALAGGVAERLASARWALDRGLVAEAAALYRLARAADPTDRAAVRMAGLVDRLEVESEPPDLGPIEARLSGPVQTAMSRHLILLHQHDEAEARARLAFLEDVYAGFFLAMAELGLDLEPPRRAQVMIRFPDRAGYRAFLRSERAEAFLNTCGYHHPTLGLVAVCDECGPGRPGDPADEAQRLAREVVREQVALGTAAHELVHRLVAASGLERRPGDFPAWFHEGLAMQFEAVRGGRWAGLAYPSPQRLADWEALVARRPGAEASADRLFDSFGAGYDRDRYALAWRVVYTLRTREPERFVSTLDAYRRRSVEPGESMSSEAQPIISR